MLIFSKQSCNSYALKNFEIASGYVSFIWWTVVNWFSLCNLSFFITLQSDGFPGGIVSQLSFTSRLDNVTSLYWLLQKDAAKMAWLACKFNFYCNVMPLLTFFVGINFILYTILLHSGLHCTPFKVIC